MALLRQVNTRLTQHVNINKCLRTVDIVWLSDENSILVDSYNISIKTLEAGGFRMRQTGRIFVEYATVKLVCNDHLYNKIYYLWFIQ